MILRPRGRMHSTAGGSTNGDNETRSPGYDITGAGIAALEVYNTAYIALLPRRRPDEHERIHSLANHKPPKHSHILYSLSRYLGR